MWCVTCLVVMLGGPAAAVWVRGVDEKRVLIIKDRGGNICFLPPQLPLMDTYVQLHVVGDSRGSSLKGGEGVTTDRVSHGQTNKLHCTPLGLVSINHLLVEKLLSKSRHLQKTEKNDLALCF